MKCDKNEKEKIKKNKKSTTCTRNYYKSSPRMFVVGGIKALDTRVG
jgi:hypothetical protein